jgi:hypothetical protein
VHVVEAERVGGLHAHGPWATIRVVVKPTVVVEHCRLVTK